MQQTVDMDYISRLPDELLDLVAFQAFSDVSIVAAVARPAFSI